MSAPLALTKARPARLTVADFMTLERAGAFRGNSKSELIDGTIYVVNAQYSRHMRVKSRLYRRFADACDAIRGFEAWVEGAVELSPHSMPEPDILVTRNTPADGPIIGDMLALAVGIFEVVAGLMIAVNFGARFFAILLIFFVLIATFYFHDFWNQASPENAKTLIDALKNLSIVGALFMIAGYGRGPRSSEPAYDV